MSVNTSLLIKIAINLKWALAATHCCEVSSISEVITGVLVVWIK